MHDRQFLISKHRMGRSARGRQAAAANPRLLEGLVATASDALEAMRHVVSRQCLTDPGQLTEDGITTYALALMRLRESACAAGFERLMNACDALAVTVAHLIEDRRCACRHKCEALTRFVVHAEAMIRMAAEPAPPRAVPPSEIRTAPAPCVPL